MRTLTAACRLGDPSLEAQVRRMHGNELRKAGHHARAVAQLRRAATLTPTDPAARGAALVLAARAAAEAGNPTLFDQATTHAARLLETSGERAPLLTRYALREVELRGAVRLHRQAAIARLLQARPGHAGGPPSPQWDVLETITRGEALLTLGESTAALADLIRAVPAAADSHLPQQLDRIIQTHRRSPRPARCGIDGRVVCGQVATGQKATSSGCSHCARSRQFVLPEHLCPLGVGRLSA